MRDGPIRTQTVSARKYYATFWRRGFSTVTRLRGHPRSSTFLPSCWIHSYLHSLGLIHAKSFPPRDGRWEGERARASYTLGLAAICACSPWPWGHVAPLGRMWSGAPALRTSSLSCFQWSGDAKRRPWLGERLETLQLCQLCLMLRQCDCAKSNASSTTDTQVGYQRQQYQLGGGLGDIPSVG